MNNHFLIWRVIFNNVIFTFDLSFTKKNHFSWVIQKVFLGHKLPRYLLHQLPSWGPGPIFEVTYHLHAQGLIHQNQKHQGHARAKFFLYLFFPSFIPFLEKARLCSPFPKNYSQYLCHQKYVVKMHRQKCFWASSGY